MLNTYLTRKPNPEIDPKLKTLSSTMMFVEKQRLVDWFTKYVFAETTKEKQEYIEAKEQYIEEFYLDKFAIYDRL